MKTVDEKIPTPAREIDKPFLMPIEDVSLSLVVELLLQDVLSAVLSKLTINFNSLVFVKHEKPLQPA